MINSSCNNAIFLLHHFTNTVKADSVIFFIFFTCNMLLIIHMDFFYITAIFYNKPNPVRFFYC